MTSIYTESHLEDLLSWVTIGLVAFIMARYVLRLKQPLGMFTTILLAVGGAAAGGLVAQYVDIGMVRSFWNVDWVSLVITLTGAFAAILVIGILRR